MTRAWGRACVWLGALVGPVAWGDDAALRQRVETEFPAALAKLDARYESMHGRAIYHDMRCPPGGKPCVEQTLQLDFALAPGLARMGITNLKPADQANPKVKRAIETVIGVNPHYGFAVTRDQPTEAYALQKISADIQRTQSTILSRHGAEVRCAVSFGFNKLSELLKIPGFQMDSVAEVDGAGGRKSLLIRYANRANHEKMASNASYIDGWILVSPDDGWIIREYGFVSTPSSGKPFKTDLGKIDYARSPDGHLDPVKLVEHFCPGRIERGAPEPPHELSVNLELTFDSVQYDALPEADFHLPAFGLPEAEVPAKEN